MEPKQNYTLVGVFVLAAMAGIILFVLWMSDLGKQGNLETYQTFVNESVNGLTVGSAVKYRGVEVGKVTSIDIPKKTPNKVRIVMDVDEDTPITVGTVAVLQMQGITGIAYVELRGAVAGGEKIPLAGNNRIPIIPSARSEFRQIVDTVPDMLQKFTELANKLGQFASAENSQRFDTILVNLEGFSNSVGKDAEGKNLVDDLRETSAQVRMAAASFKETTNSTRGDMQRILKNSAVTIEKINTLADSTNELSAQGYQDLHESLLELKKTARDLQSLSRTLKENPSQVVIPNQQGGVAVPKN